MNYVVMLFIAGIGSFITCITILFVETEYNGPSNHDAIYQIVPKNPSDDDDGELTVEETDNLLSPIPNDQYIDIDEQAKM